MACALIVSLSTVPKLSWMALAREPKQLVVQEALLAISCELSYFSRFTLTGNMAAAAEGAEIMTLFAPPFKWTLTFSMVVVIPGDDTTYQISLLEDGDSLPIDKVPVLSHDYALKLTMGRLALEHVDHIVEVNEGVTGGNIIHIARVEGSPGDQDPKMTKSFTPTLASKQCLAHRLSAQSKSSVQPSHHQTVCQVEEDHIPV